MRRILALAICVVSLTAAPATASAPVDTEIVIDTILPPDGSPSFGPFTASGGVVCPSGDSFDLATRGAGGQSGARLQLLVLKRFICADGSGTFDVFFRVHLTFDPFTDVASWSVVGGTGAYARLHGSGKLVGLATPTGVRDVLTGGMHTD